MGSWVGVPNALASELVRDSEMAGVVVCVGCFEWRRVGHGDGAM